MLGMESVPIPAIPPPIHLRARELVRAEDREETGTGELRRHRVYAKLLKEFPKEPRWHLGLAIELAVMYERTG